MLPIGGLKEKALGALRGGIRTVILPEKNKNDLSEIPANIKRKIKFITVRHMDEVLPIALEEAVQKKKAAMRKKTSSKSTKAPEN